jgi:hypothetical protein
MVEMPRPPRQPDALALLRGAIAGALATVPMTAVMEAWYRRLPVQERYPLPPREITERLEEQTAVSLPRDEPTRAGLTLLAHFGYGAAAGSVYGLSAPPSLPSSMLRGATYGLFVWGGSYLGWLPALGILRPATEHPARRTLLMVVAHLVWGAATGALTYALASGRVLQGIAGGEARDRVASS